MAFAIQARIEGVGDVLKALDGLDAKVRKQALKAGIGKAAQVVLRAARGRAPVKEGWLRKSLGQKIKVYRNSGAVVAIVGPRTGFKRTRQGKRVASAFGKKLFSGTRQRPVNYAHLVEKGHGGPHPARAHPFLQPALESSQGAIVQAIEAAVRAALEKAGK